MRRPPTEPMLSIYRSHDRELLFHGNLAAGQARGIKINLAKRYVKLDGKQLRIVNHHLPTSGDVSLWVAA